ncbi:hypothetical protein MAHJHV63_50350 [Mycobacterium avium subsp. hominissuis]
MAYPRPRHTAAIETKSASATVGQGQKVLGNADYRGARDRGATMAEIASALGSTEQAVYARYADYAVRRKRR